MPLEFEKDKPPTYTGWCQFRERGEFREWYKRGPIWLRWLLSGPGPHGAKDDIGTCPHCGGTLPPITGKVFHAMHGPRGDDGYTYLFPTGMQPPAPAPEPSNAKRPGTQQSEE